MRTEITRKQAQGFYADLCGTYNGNADRTGQVIAGVAHIAETMGIPEQKAYAFCAAMLRYGITEKQGRKIVI